MEKRSEMSFELLTEDSEGEVVRVGSEESDLMSLSLTGGRLSASLRLGSHSAEKVSQLKVSGAGWVRVSLERTGGQMLVRINRDQDIFALKTSEGRVLRSDGYMRLGGNLTGRMRNIKIKNRTVHNSDFVVL